MRRLNWNTIALIGGLVLLVLVILFFATRGNSDQDKLTNANLTAGSSPSREKLCASQGTYDLIKRDLFRRAAQLRGSDQAAYDQIAASASLRMENPVMESQDSSTGAVHCSGSLSLDLPPGVAVVGGRRTLSADVDYSVQQAADGSGPVVLLANAESIVTPLATLARTATPPATSEDGQNTSPPVPIPAPAPGSNAEPAQPAPAPPAPPPPAPAPTQTGGARPSFNCANAHTRGEIAVCGDARLAALDRNMAAQFNRGMAAASPGQRDLLRQTRDAFLRYRDRCPNNACVAGAYVDRMREIRDIMDGRWQPPR